MCGGTAQTTQQVSIPPEVMQNYRAVNARANEVAATPFQQYSTDPNAFVAPINQAQQTGMNAISAAGGVAQPYFQGATQQLMGGQAAATPYYGEATQQLLGGLNAGVTGTQAAYQPLQQGAQYAQGLQGGAYNQYQNALQSSQPYNQAAGQYAQAGLGAATPYYGQAAQNITGAQDVGGALGGASLSSLQQAGQAAQPLQSDAAGNINSAASAAQPLNQAAIRNIMQGGAAANPIQRQAANDIANAGARSQPLQGAAANTFGSAASGAEGYNQAGINSILQGINAAQPLQGNAAGNINAAMGAAQPMQNYAAGNISSATSAAQPLNQAALRSVMQGNRAAQPLQQQAAAGLGAAQAGAQPYQQLATNFGLSGSQAVNAGPLGGEQINQYMSPYLDSVVGSTMANLRQQQGQEQSSLVGNQVAQGAFGGDRGRLAQANLARQQNLATGQTVSGLMNQGYGQALGAAQQQQQLGLGAAQANRAAQQQASQQMLGIGQQGFGQGMATAQQQAALGQQLFGQGMATSQQQANLGQQGFGQQLSAAQAAASLGQQQYGQQLGTGQAQAGLGQQLYGQGLGAGQAVSNIGQQQYAQQMGAGQAQASLGQQEYGQQIGTGQARAALGQQLYGQGVGTGQALAGVGQQQYGQQMGTGQAQAALGQQLYGQGANTAQQQAAMGQQLYGQGMGAASAQQGLGQGLYGMGTGMGGFMQGLGQQNYAQQSGTGQNLAQLGQQAFGQGAAQSGQQAALAQQQYGMGAGAAGQMAGLGQGLYGMGAGTSQALAGMGTQAQQNALAAGQAQLGAGTVAQQTQQAGQTALYNQFLQQQGFPYQQAQFLANIAMGTGALSGSTTNTTQAAPFFSDKRLKEAVEPIGKTFDGQNIVKFRYKNEPGTRIGLIAQDVEKHHPEAVGLAGGYKTVDYDAATKDAASKGHYARGGLAPESEGGAVLPAMMRHGFAEGGNPAQLIGNDQLAAILQAQFGMYNNQGIPGLGGSPGASGFVPAGTLPVGNLTVAGNAPKLPESQLKGMIEAAGGVEKAYDTGKQAVNKIKGLFNKEDDSPTSQASAPENESSLAARRTQEELDEELGHYRGGLVGHYASGGASSGPYGIPISKVETPDLITAGDAPEFQKSGFLKMLDTAGDLASLGSQAASASSKSKAAGGAAEDDVGAGTPYDAGSNPFMPDSAKGIEKKELAKPGAAPGAPESGFSQAMSAANSVAKIAALAMKLNRGGRTGYANGGESDSSILDNPHDVLLRAWQQKHEEENKDSPTVMSAYQPPIRPQGGSMEPYNPPPLTSAEGLYRSPGVANVMAFKRPQPSSNQLPSAMTKGVAGPVRPVTTPSARRSTGLIPTPTPRPDLDGDASPAITSANMAPGLGGRNPPPPISSDLAGSPAYQQRGLAPVQAPTDTHAAENALLARTGLSAPNIRQDLQKDADKKPSFLERAERTIAPKGGYLDRLTSGNEADLIPFLTGLGAMAGSSNRYGLGALMEGVGAGAAAYQPTKIGQAKISQAGSQATGAALDTMKNSITTINGIPYFLTSDGKMLTATQWRQMGRPRLLGGDTAIIVANKQLEKEGGQPQPVAQADTSNAPPPLPKQGVDQDMYDAAETEVQRMESLPEEARNLLTSTNTKMMMDAKDARDNAVMFGDTLNEGAKAFFPQFKSGVLTPGAGQTGRAAAVNVWNTLMRGLGYGANATLEEGLSNQQVAAKTTAVLAGQRTAGLGQTALESLRAVAAGIPNGEMNQGAVARVMSDMYVQNQRAVDYAQFLEQYAASHPDAPYIIGQGAQTLFNKKYNEQYETDKASLEKIFRSFDTKTGEALVDYLFGRGKDKALQAVRTPEAFEKEYGKGITRYITRLGQ